jgi:hypothetical protein
MSQNGGAVENQSLPEEEIHGECDDFFGKSMRLFLEIDEHDKLFPKVCRTCGRTFGSFSEYLDATTPKGHSFEDCQEIMGKPFTMIYRHCLCGNTLVLTLTEEVFPMLDLFWSILKEEAEMSGRPLKELVTEFATKLEYCMAARMNAAR